MYNSMLTGSHPVDRLTLNLRLVPSALFTSTRQPGQYIQTGPVVNSLFQRTQGGFVLLLGRQNRYSRSRADGGGGHGGISGEWGSRWLSGCLGGRDRGHDFAPHLPPIWTEG